MPCEHETARRDISMGDWEFCMKGTLYLRIIACCIIKFLFCSYDYCIMMSEIR